MSYCRFENTKSDLADCLEALDEYDYDVETMANDLSDTEASAMRRLVEMCQQIADGAAYHED